MKVFHCDHCGSLVFFENTRCVSCGHVLAFLPDLMVVGSLDPVETSGLLWKSPLPASEGRAYRLCANYRDAQVCNWSVDARDANPLCRSCRLTRVIPDQGVDGNQRAWYRLEVAKRRLLYTLLSLHLPIADQDDTDPRPAFKFLADAGPQAHVLTGHADGTITINIAEADDAERERRRADLGEPYRTLLGHMRHEIGHYYWKQLVQAAPDRLARFRDLFGDDRIDYQAALQDHYDGPSSDWQDRFISNVRERASVGGLGRNVGALPAHVRYGRDSGGLRRVTSAQASRRPGSGRGCLSMPGKRGHRSTICWKAGFRLPIC